MKNKGYKIAAALLLTSVIGATAYTQNYKVENMMIEQIEQIEEPIETVVEPETIEVVEPEIISQPVEKKEVIHTPIPEPTPIVTNENPYPAGSNPGYIYDKRQQEGRVVGAWGGLNSWIGGAREAGATISDIPVVGSTAILYRELGYYVEKINDEDDTILFSWMSDGKIIYTTYPISRINGEILYIY